MPSCLVQSVCGGCILLASPTSGLARAGGSPGPSPCAEKMENPHQCDLSARLQGASRAGSSHAEGTPWQCNHCFLGTWTKGAGEGIYSPLRHPGHLTTSVVYEERVGMHMSSSCNPVKAPKGAEAVWCADVGREDRLPPCQGAWSK